MIFDKSLLSAILSSNNLTLRSNIGDLLTSLSVPKIDYQGQLPSVGPVLVISNHLGVFDTLVLLSTIHRPDYFFVALATYGIFGSEVKKRLLPIYRVRRLNHYLYEYPLCLQISGSKPPALLRDQTRQQNRATISRAAKLIDQGNIVSIFPTGSVGKSLTGSNWKPGVGFLVKQLKHPVVKVVFAEIEGTRQSDLVAFLRPILRRVLFRPQPITIRYSRSYPLDELIDRKMGAKEITRQLETAYKRVFRR